MKERIIVRLSAELLRKLGISRANPPGLKYVPRVPGQPVPARPAETPTVDPVTELLDQKLPRVGGV